MPTFLSQTISLVQDRNAKSTNTYISSRPTSPIIEEEEENNKDFIDENITIDMTRLQKPINPITIPAPAHPKLDLKLQQSSPITSTPLIRPLSFSVDTPTVIRMPTISIWTAAEQHDVETLTYYIQHHPNPAALLNKRDPKTECTLLHLAVSSSHPNPYSTLELLLRHGADPCARNVYNVQALHTIPLHIEWPKDSLVLLLDHGADVNARDGDGWTAIHYAARFCRPHSLSAVLRLLVQRGADVSAVDASKKTAVFALLANGDHVDSFAYLIRNTPFSRGDFLDTTTRRSHRGTVVLQAAKYLRVECLEWLVQSPQAMDRLLPALTPDELAYAIQLVQQQQHHTCQKILALLDQVSAKMIKGPVHSPTISNAIQRRLSIISTKRNRRHTQDTDQDDDFYSPTLFKRMTNFFTNKRPIVVQEQVV